MFITNKEFGQSVLSQVLDNNCPTYEQTTKCQQFKDLFIFRNNTGRQNSSTSIYKQRPKDKLQKVDNYE